MDKSQDTTAGQGNAEKWGERGLEGLLVAEVGVEAACGEEGFAAHVHGDEAGRVEGAIFVAVRTANYSDTGYPRSAPKPAPDDSPASAPTPGRTAY